MRGGYIHTTVHLCRWPDGQGSNCNFEKASQYRDEEKVKKQDGMSMIILNYSDKIIRK